jgi:hypothetical protein
MGWVKKGGDFTMEPANEAPVSAQVVIKADKSAGYAAAREEFMRAGFTVGPLVGVSFSIAGPRDLFERYFDVRISRPGERDSLPVDRLPAKLREAVKSILFTRPPDFGPTSYA